MARDRDERYNTAEDFAFDLARVEERLKRDMVSHFVDQARASIAKSDLAKAKELLSQVLKIDTQHTAAKQLMYEVQATLQREQRGERIQQLRVQAEDAIVGKQFDEATSYVDQAIKLDKTDPDLLNLREQIQQARLRAQQVKKLLNLAAVAQQSGQFDMAQKAVADALALDPDDTDAKVLQAAVARMLVEQEKQDQIQQLLQAARREISGRQFTAAHDNIRKAEAIDPTHPEIPGLKQMVVAGHEQEVRRRELAQLCIDIEHLLVDSKSTAARDLAETALRKFPGEPKLVKLKAAAETAIEQEERKAYLEERIGNASRLAEAGDAARALSLLKEAERQYPTDTRLREFVQVIRQAAMQQAAEKDKQEFLQKARSAMQRKNFVDAIDVLEQAVILYPDESEIRDLLSAAREDFERLSKKKQVEEVSQQARDLLASHAHTDAIRLLERTSAQVADPDLLRLLEYARQEAAAYRSNLKQTQQQATAMLNSGRDTEALKFLEAHVPTFERSAEFQVLLEQTRKHVAEAQQARERLARRVEDARRLIREGDMFQAEAILRTCQAEAPHDSEVLLLAVEVEEAQKARQLQQQEEARRASEVQRQEEGRKARERQQQEEARKARERQEQQEAAAKAAQGRSSDQTAIFREAAAPMSSTQLFGGTGAHAAPAAPPVEAPAPPPTVVEPPAREKLDKKEKAAKTHAPPPPEPEPPTDGGKKKLIIIAVAAVVLLVAGIGIWKMLTKTSVPPKEPGPVGVQQAIAHLTIRNVPAGAEIRIDDVVQNVTVGADGSVSIETTPGAHDVQISKEGYEPYSHSLTLTGQPQELAAEMKPLPVGLKMGNLLVTANQDRVSVFANAQYKGSTAGSKTAKLQLEPGSYMIVGKKTGFEDSTPQKIKITADQDTPISFDLKPALDIADVIIRAKPGTSVSFDGGAPEPVGGDGTSSAKVKSGKHSVDVTQEGYGAYSTTFSVKAGERKEIAVPALPPKPITAALSANPTTIQQGGGVTLTWQTQNATDVSIDGIGRVSPSGSREVHPNNSPTTEYTLTAKGPGGSTTAKFTVAVKPPSAQPVTIEAFLASPDSIEKGGQAKLSWQTQNATKVSIDHGVGSVDPKGERTVSPSETTEYTLTATSPEGSKTSTKRVTVTTKGPSDDELIKETFDRYKLAFARRDAKILKSAVCPSFPGVPAIEIIFKTASQITLVEDCTAPRVTGTDADFSCRESQTYVIDGNSTSRKGSPQFLFKKAGGNWCVADKR